MMISSLHVNHVRDTYVVRLPNGRDPDKPGTFPRPGWGERERDHIPDMILVAVLPIEAGDGPEEHDSYFI